MATNNKDFRVKNGLTIEGSSGLVAPSAILTASSASSIPAIIKGAASQTGDLLQIQNSSGGNLVRVANNGFMQVLHGFNSQGFTTVSGVLTALFTASTVDRTPLGIRGQSSQTADLLQIQNSAGTVIAGIGAFGNAAFGAAAPTSEAALFVSASANPAVVPLRVRGVASQTADLLQLQNSAGTNIVRVSAAGTLASGTWILSGEQSGGGIALVRSTAANANPTANLGRIYFRDGTTSGTLKLVVRAGASGEEQTLFDNIPQTSGTTTATIDGGTP